MGVSVESGTRRQDNKLLVVAGGALAQLQVAGWVHVVADDGVLTALSAQWRSQPVA